MTISQVSDETAVRRAVFMRQLVLGTMTSIPILGLLVIIVVYAGMFGQALVTTRKLYLTLPFVVVAGLIHWFVPPAVFVAFGGFWPTWFVTSFVLWWISVYGYTRISSI